MGLDMRTPSSPPAATHAGERLLVVTDDLNRTERFATRARRAGYAVAVAAGKNVALLRLPTFAPEIVALSFRYPMREGLEVLRLLRASGSGASIVWVDDHRTPKLATLCDLGRLLGLGKMTRVCRYLPSERLAEALRNCTARPEPAKSATL